MNSNARQTLLAQAQTLSQRRWYHAELKRVQRQAGRGA